MQRMLIQCPVLKKLVSLDKTIWWHTLLTISQPKKYVEDWYIFIPGHIWPILIKLLLDRTQKMTQNDRMNVANDSDGIWAFDDRNE